MADYQNNPQQQDPAGSTQMFRAFVDDGSTTARRSPEPSAGATATYGSSRSSGGSSRTGVVVGVVVALVVIAAVVYFAMA